MHTKESLIGMLTGTGLVVSYCKQRRLWIAAAVPVECSHHLFLLLLGLDLIKKVHGTAMVIHTVIPNVQVEIFQMIAAGESVAFLITYHRGRIMYR